MALSETCVTEPVVEVLVLVRVASSTSSAGLPAGYANWPKPVQRSGQLHLDLRVEQHGIVAGPGRFIRMTEGWRELRRVGGRHDRKFAVVAAAAGARHVRQAEALDRMDVVVVAGGRVRLLAVARRRRGVGVGRPLHHARRQAGGRFDAACPAGTGFGELLASVPISGSTYCVNDRLRLSSRLVVSAAASDGRAANTDAAVPSLPSPPPHPLNAHAAARIAASVVNRIMIAPPVVHAFFRWQSNRSNRCCVVACCRLSAS